MFDEFIHSILSLRVVCMIQAERRDWNKYNQAIFTLDRNQQLHRPDIADNRHGPWEKNSKIRYLNDHMLFAWSEVRSSFAGLKYVAFEAICDREVLTDLLG